MAKKKDNLGEYEVGYKKPPKKHQFKPGESGNPSGRRKKRIVPKSVPAYLAEEMLKPVKLTENGRVFEVPNGQALAMKMLRDALSGDAKDRIRFVNLLDKHNIDWVQNAIAAEANEAHKDEFMLEEHRRFLEDARREVELGVLDS